MKEQDLGRRPLMVIRYLIVALFALSSSVYAGTTFNDSFSFKLQHRTYDFYVPDNLPDNAAMVLELHGHARDRKTLQEVNYGEWKKIADREGIIVVWPQGGTPLLNSWNGGSCCFPANLLNIDDRGYLKEVIKRVRANYSIDGARIYMTGHSNGGNMSHRMGLQSADTIAAIAPIAFQLTDNITWKIPRSWYPDRPVPQAEYHSEDDETIPYNGGFFLQPGLFLDSTLKGFESWGEINGCSENSQQSLNPSRVGSIDLLYDDCGQDIETKFVTVATGGHRGLMWEERNGGFNLQQDIWNFFKDYRKPGHEGDRIWGGQRLSQNQYLLSPDRSKRLLFSDNGGIRLEDIGSRQVLWSTANGSAADIFSMQSDGNLVLYRSGHWGMRWIFPVYIPTTAVWASHTVGIGESRVQVTNDGKLQILRNNEVVWSKG